MTWVAFKLWGKKRLSAISRLFSLEVTGIRLSVFRPPRKAFYSFYCA
ncbi:hypothetical protein MPNT_90024 [Candidatus Methylacidithermus pantelleriae]|uniref:Uncharacterized protein n=1 Tax=Candidatus Methylacidithermus pantelleriae TaxID=2744239 RepID=A0A8J2FUZ7_9BACT|nr:hypothetical protein MPNT_90024 [Candidatus Methylacidithermus pantelleriae]